MKEENSLRSYIVPAMISARRRRGLCSSRSGKKGELTMEDEDQEQSPCHFCRGLLIGGILGVLAGIFFAPKSGKELRSDIRAKGNDVLKDAKEIYDNAGAKVKEIIKDAKHQGMKLKNDAEGTGEKIAGEVQEKIGQIKKVFGT
jgi:gas vesicle protein